MGSPTGCDDLINHTLDVPDRHGLIRSATRSLSVSAFHGAANAFFVANAVQQAEDLRRTQSSSLRARWARGPGNPAAPSQHPKPGEGANNDKAHQTSSNRNDGGCGASQRVSIARPSHSPRRERPVSIRRWPKRSIPAERLALWRWRPMTKVRSIPEPSASAALRKRSP